MRRFASSLLLATLLAVPGLAAAGEHEAYTVGPLTVADPWARASAGDNGAAFMVITTKGKSADRLVSASSPVAKTVELHTHIMEGDIMRMRAVEDIPVSAAEPAVLKPGGLHVMLIGLKQPLKEGAEFPLTLTFADAGSVTVEVDVKSVAAGAPSDMDGHMHKH